jgi:hypothetical protein
MQIDDVREAKGAERGHVQGHTGRDVANGVAPAVAIAAGVRQLTDANTVQDDEDDSAEISRRWGRRQASWVE